MLTYGLRQPTNSKLARCVCTSHGHALFAGKGGCTYDPPSAPLFNHLTCSMLIACEETSFRPILQEILHVHSQRKIPLALTDMILSNVSTEASTIVSDEIDLSESNSSVALTVYKCFDRGKDPSICYHLFIEDHHW